jgi:hypothetical protein
VTLAPVRGDGTCLVSRTASGRPMSTAPLPMAPTARLELDNVLLPRNGLQLPRQLPFDAWLEVGRRLSAVASSSAWCLGDWLIYGEVSFTGRYRDAIERTALDYQTLRNYAWVARKIPFSRRREKLSFGHHAEVAALPEPEQEYWLRKAQELQWSRNQIRHEVRQSLRERKECAETQPADGPQPTADAQQVPSSQPAAAPSEITIRMTVTSSQLEAFRQAANQDGCTIEDWALLILEQAAQGSQPLLERL